MKIILYIQRQNENQIQDCLFWIEYGPNFSLESFIASSSMECIFFYQGKKYF